MATKVISTAVTAELTTADGDRLTVLNTGSISSSTHGIAGSGRGVIDIYGTVLGADDGVRVVDAMDNYVTIGGAGSVVGRHYGIELVGNGRVFINNAGVIHGEQNGVVLSGYNVNVSNTGIITGQEREALVLDSSIAVNVVNHGIIGSANSFFSGNAVRINSLVANFINSGTVKGSIHIKGTEVQYNGQYGTATNGISLDALYVQAVGGTANDDFTIVAEGATVDGGAGVDTLTLLTGTTDVVIDLRNHHDQNIGTGTVRLLNVENLLTRGGHDFLTGNDLDNRLSGGDGNDRIEGLFGNDIIDGNDGIDTALFSGITGVRVDLTKQGHTQNTGYGFDTLHSIENLEGGSGADWLQGDDKANVLTGHGGNDTLIGGKGNDTLDGGSGLNAAVFAGSASLSTVTNNGDGTFTVTGPDGTDLVKGIRLLQFADTTMALWNTAPTALGLSKSVVSEDALAGTILASLSAVDADGDTLSYSLAAGSPFRLDGNNLILAGALDFETTASHSLTVVARDAFGGQVSQTFTLQVMDAVEETPFTLIGTARADRLEGEAGNDVLTGLGGNDTLLGEAGNDKLYGGAGRDVLSGGAGQDIFVFDSRPNKTTNLDRITDFKVADDTIHLKKSVFSKMAKKGVIKAGEFYQGTKAHDRDDHVIYNKKTGALFYDADGTGAQAQVQIATLSKNLKMTYKDFFVV